MRHPRSTGKSLYEMHRRRQGKDAEAADAGNTERIENYWFKVHDRILRFTERLPARQSIRLQGELLLTDPQSGTSPSGQTAAIQHVVDRMQQLTPAQAGHVANLVDQICLLIAAPEDSN